MLETSDFRRGLKIMVEGNPYEITDFQHVKPGKGNQFSRTKLRNLLTGQNLERTFKSGEKFEEPDVTYKTVNFLYKDESGFHFMDQTNFEQIALNSTEISDAYKYLTENLEVSVLYYNGRPISVQTPNSVVLTVIQTDPGHKGNTVTNTYKPAKLETGHVVQVPLHISEGDRLKVDTRTGDYIERVNS